MLGVTADLGEDYEPTESELEDLILEVVLAFQLEEAERQRRAMTASGS